MIEAVILLGLLVILVATDPLPGQGRHRPRTRE